MIAGPALPDGSAEALGRAKDLVAGFGSGAILPPSPPILADGDDRGAAALQDRGAAAARVERAVSGHGAGSQRNRHPIALSFGVSTQ